MARLTTGSIYQRNAVWWVKYYIPGQAKPIRQSTGTTDRDEAIKQLRLKMASQPPPVAAVTVGYLLDLLIADWQQAGRKSTANVRSKIDTHLRPAFGTMKPAAVGSRAVQLFIQQKQRQELANATINRLLAALRRAFNLGYQQDPPLVAHVPHFPRLPEAAPRSGLIGHDTYRQLCNLLPQHARLALVISYHTGARKGEILTIRRADVDMTKRRIERPAKATKSGHARYLPIYGDMVGEIEMALAQPAHDCPFLIRRSFKKRPGVAEVLNFAKAWATACQLAQVPAALFHDLRRTALTNMIDAGLPEREAMEISGHRTRAVFDRYHIVTAKRLEANARKLEAALTAKDAQLNTAPADRPN
jgi:integrase